MTRLYDHWRSSASRAAGLASAVLVFRPDAAADITGTADVG